MELGEKQPAGRYVAVPLPFGARPLCRSCLEDEMVCSSRTILKSSLASCFPSSPPVPSTSVLLGGWQGGLAGPPPAIALLGMPGFAPGPRSTGEYALQLRQG